MKKHPVRAIGQSVNTGFTVYNSSDKIVGMTDSIKKAMRLAKVRKGSEVWQDICTPNGLVIDTKLYYAEVDNN
jgi:hypothetical protein